MYRLFDINGRHYDNEVYTNEQDALDMEEAICYDALEMGAEPPALFVHEVNQDGTTVREVHSLV